MEEARKKWEQQKEGATGPPIVLTRYIMNYVCRSLFVCSVPRKPAYLITIV